MSRSIVPITLALTVALGIADYATGIDITFFVFTQVFPIGLGTWFRGKRYGAVLAVLATGFGLATFFETHVFGVPMVANVIGTLGTLLVLVWTLAALHDYVQQERRARRIAIEQLRHAERLKVIGTLAAGVAHELGTPLNVISGTAEMLEAELSHAKVRELSGVIIAQTDRISAIVRHLLDFGRRGGAAKEIVDLNQLAAAAVELLSATARKSNVAISLVPAGTAIRARVNGAEIEQVVSNLLLNGIQAMPRGGNLEISTSLAPESIARITVRDEGTGIGEADLQRIFDPFFTTKGIGEGTGLGLSVSHGIVADHEGTIDVQSAVGQGTTFVVCLPSVA